MKILKTIVALLVPFTLVFLLCSFVMGSINPASWTEGARAVTAVITAVIWLFIIPFILVDILDV